MPSSSTCLWGSPDNLAREPSAATFPMAAPSALPGRHTSATFRERYARARSATPQAAALKWLAAHPTGRPDPGHLRRLSSPIAGVHVPVLAAPGRGGGLLELRIFNRDGRKSRTRGPTPPPPRTGTTTDALGSSCQERGECASSRVAWFYTALPRAPAVFDTPVSTRIRSRADGPGPARGDGDPAKIGGREFLALQGSPFFDLWAAAAVDEILSALYEKRNVGGT